MRERQTYQKTINQSIKHKKHKLKDIDFLSQMASDKHNSSTTTCTTTTKSSVQPLSLPPRPSFETIFGPPGASPGPMSLVSSFFATDTPSSFSQLLAGAMASPLARTPQPGFGDGSMSPLFGLFSPSAGLLSPSGGLFGANQLPSGFFSPGPFGMSHQQALAQVTAQAALAQSHMHVQAEYPISSGMVQSEQLTHQTSFLPISNTQQQTFPSTKEPKAPAMDSSNVTHSDKKSQPPMTLDKPADDGYNWRKYGQKQVKGSEHPRSYYKCTYQNCPVKKKIERSLDGQISEIIYKGQHSHEKPLSNKRSRDGNDPNANGGTKPQARPDLGSHNQTGNLNSSFEFASAQSLPSRDDESTQTAPTQITASCDGEEVDDCDARLKKDGNDETHPKRRNTEGGPSEVASLHKTVAEPKIIVQTRSEVDLLDDGYRWRKYGQKVVKGNPHPRSYYKCTYTGCNVRKHVERAPADAKAVITTYEGKHNHDVPASRGGSHNAANNNASRNTAVENASLHRGTNFGNDGQRPVVLQLKEEQIKV